jgi:hypothetical protein
MIEKELPDHDYAVEGYVVKRTTAEGDRYLIHCKGEFDPNINKATLFPTVELAEVYRDEFDPEATIIHYGF